MYINAKVLYNSALHRLVFLLSILCAWCVVYGYTLAVSDGAILVYDSMAFVNAVPLVNWISAEDQLCASWHLIVIITMFNSNSDTHTHEKNNNEFECSIFLLCLLQQCDDRTEKSLRREKKNCIYCWMNSTTNCVEIYYHFCYFHHGRDRDSASPVRHCPVRRINKLIFRQSRLSSVAKGKCARPCATRAIYNHLSQRRICLFFQFFCPME